jgi:hypothetical protein
MLVALGVLVALAGCLPPPSDGEKTSPGVPVLGQSRLTADQLVAYYNARTHPDFRAADTTIQQLAALYVWEGNVYNVRGDIAFAQAIIETSWFNYPDCTGCLLHADSHNYAGIGACTSCSNGNQFPNPVAGVLAQMQLLRNMADASSRAANLPDPPIPALWGADPATAAANFDHYSLKGRAPLWNDMSGVWASSPAYSTTVVGVYNDMLRFTANYNQCPVDGLQFGDVTTGGGCPVDLRQPGRSIANTPTGGYYVLNGDGAVTAYAGAPYYGAPTFASDAARDLAVMPNGDGYAVLSGDGHVAMFGSAASPDTLGALGSPDWPGADIARSIAITPDGKGYVILDEHGGVWKFGTATAGALGSLANPSWPDTDTARAIAMMPDGAGYLVLDSGGGVWKYGSATTGVIGSATTPPLGPGDSARDLLVVSFIGPVGYVVLDGTGALYSGGLLKPFANPAATPGADRWRGMALTGGTVIALKDDAATSLAN